MKCEDFVQRMDDYLDSALPENEQKTIDAHLTECDHCRRQIRSTQALLCQAAALPKTIEPDHDLWPAVKANIQASGMRHRSITELARLRWNWRVAAVLVAIAALMLAAMIVFTNHRESRPNSEPDPTVRRNVREELQAPKAKLAPSSISKQITEETTNGAIASENSSARLGQVKDSTSCECEPSAETLGVIENALLVDESLPSSRSVEVVSDRLFARALENNDDFFLLKTSLDVLPFPYRVPESVRARFKGLHIQYPDNAGITYLYSYTLFGTSTPEMIRLMKQLIAENPSFPWPNLALAKAYGFPNMPVDMSSSGYIYNDPNKIQTHIRAFMKLCPQSPEPIRVLFPATDSPFFSATVLRMRELLVTRTDTRSLLMYPALWQMEGDRRMGVVDMNELRRRLSADLKQLQNMAAGRPAEFLFVLVSGYQKIGDMGTVRALVAKDGSYEGRNAFVAFDSQEWSANNPAPASDTTMQVKTAYWEKRLQKNDEWIKKAPESTFAWMDRLKALSELKGHPESEFIAVGERVQSLLRENDGFYLDFLKTASLYANRDVRLEQIPSMIREGLVVAEKRDLETKNDLVSAEFNIGMGRFNEWQYAENAWHALFDAYVRIADMGRARSVLDEVAKGLVDWRKQIADLQSGIRPVNSLSLSTMTNGLVASEKWLTEARGRLGSGK